MEHKWNRNWLGIIGNFSQNYRREKTNGYVNVKTLRKTAIFERIWLFELTLHQPNYTLKTQLNKNHVDNQLALLRHYSVHTTTTVMGACLLRRKNAFDDHM